MALDMDLDILGTQPALFKLYTQLAFVFALSDPTSHQSIVQTITRGLDKLAHTFPWVAGQVVNTNPDPTGPPQYKIQPYKATPDLIVKDYSSAPDVPTLDDMTAADFPMSMLSENLWAPCLTLAAAAFDPARASGGTDEPAPVMLVQLSFIKGGVVFCVNMQHNTCDMLGQAAVMQWLSKACRDEAFTQEEVALRDIERTGTIPLIEQENWTPGPELAHQLFPPQPTPLDMPVVASTAPPACSWTYFTFPAASLAALKHTASNTLPPSFTGYISTDDALSAFIFQSVLRARAPRLPEIPVTLARAVDARRYLDLPANYPGILTNMAYTTYPLSTLLAMPLGHIAAALRREIDPSTSDVGGRTRALATFMAQAPGNAAKTSLTATLRPDADVMLSSWTKVAAYEWGEFGLGLGSPRAVRRPGFVPVESLMYGMPRNGDGSVALAVCLREEDLGRLRGDGGWCEFARWVG